MNLRTYSFAAIAAALLAVCAGTPLAAATDVSGHQYGTWSLAGSPYTVTSTVTVPLDSTLTIEAGVVVSLADSQSIVVEGTLDAVGTSERKITFTASDGTGPGAWNSIQFREGSAGTLVYCSIRYAGRAEDAAIVCSGEAAPTIASSEIAHAGGSGVAVHGNASPVLGPNLVFAGLDSLAVRNTGSDTVNARGNWWGHASGPRHSGNPSGEGLGVTDGVDYADFLTEVPVLWPPAPSAGPTLASGKDAYLPHEPIVVDFSSLPGNPEDWITVVLASADSTTHGQWLTTQGETGGSRTFHGLPQGDYEARLYYSWPDGGYTVRARAPFTVEDGAPAPPEDWTALRVINPGGEREAAIGWTTRGDFRAGQGAVRPHDGESYFWGGADVDTSMGTQDIDVTAYASLIDTERLTVRIGAWMRVYEDSNDAAQLRVEYYNNEDELLASVSPDSASTASWTEHHVERRPPAGTATIRIGLSAHRNIGADNDGYFDAVYARVKVADPPPEAPTVRLSTTAITFDTTAVGAASVMPLTITNAGPGFLTVTEITLTGDNPAAFEVSPPILTVGPDSSGIVSVSFAPAFVGSKSATISLVHNGPDSPSRVAIGGRAKAAPLLLANANIRVPNDFPTIQAAIDAADSGDVVRVSAGTYVETLRLRPDISVLGAGAGTTLIDSAGDNVVRCANNSVIAGFTISGGDNGVFVPDSLSATVEQCVISDNNTGVYSFGATALSRNIVTGNDLGALIRGPSTLIANNAFVLNRGEDGVGIVLFETGAQIINNTIDANELAGIYILAPEAGDLPSLDIRSNIITSNGDAGIAADAFDAENQVIAYNNAWSNTTSYDGVVPGADFLSSDSMYRHPVTVPSGKPSVSGGLAATASRIRARVRPGSPEALGMAEVPDGTSSISTKMSVQAVPAFDYRLTEGSPSIDAGDPGEAYTDQDDTRNDQGAYGGPNPLTLEVLGEPEPPPQAFVMESAVVEQVDLDGSLLTVKHGDLGTADLPGDSLSITGIAGQTIGLSDLETGWTLEVRGTVTTAGVLTALSATVTAVPPAPPIGPGEDGLGPLALDLDVAAGHQGQYEGTTVLAAGDSVTVELIATHGAAGMLGADIVLEYNDEKLSFASASISSDLLAEGQVVPDTTVGRLSLTIESTGEPPSRNGGSLVQITFGALVDLPKETTVRLVSGSFAVGSGTLELAIGAAGSMVVVGGITADQPKTFDFSGDGLVNFQDFVQFAQNFGRQLGEADYDARFDLDGDDKVGFEDFVAFAQAFGQTAGKPSGRSAAASPR